MTKDRVVIVNAAATRCQMVRGGLTRRGKSRYYRLTRSSWNRLYAVMTKMTAYKRDKWGIYEARDKSRSWHVTNCQPVNPVGMAWTADERAILADWMRDTLARLSAR